MASTEHQMIVDMLKTNRPIDPNVSIDEMRAGLEAMIGNAPLRDGTRCAPVRADGVPCEWIDAAGVTSGPVILYLHGGGYVIGSINTHRNLVAHLSAASGCRGFAVDYRLAPEHPFPAAVEDATAADRWLLGQGTPPNRVVVAGDSAGGGLTVATLLALRDAGTPLPAAGVCLSPWTDLACDSPSMTTKADVDPMVQRDGLRRMAAAYLGTQSPTLPLASPVHADLRGLPPLLVQVGTAETLLDDSTRLAERALAAGVNVTLDPWEDMVHVFQAFVPMVPEANAAIDQIGAFVRKWVA